MALPAVRAQGRRREAAGAGLAAGRAAGRVGAAHRLPHLDFAPDFQVAGLGLGQLGWALSGKWDARCDFHAAFLPAACSLGCTEQSAPLSSAAQGRARAAARRARGASGAAAPRGRASPAGHADQRAGPSGHQRPAGRGRRRRLPHQRPAVRHRQADWQPGAADRRGGGAPVRRGRG